MNEYILNNFPFIKLDFFLQILQVKIVQVWQYNDFGLTIALNIAKMQVHICCKIGTVYNTIIMENKYIVMLAYRYILPNILSFWVNISTSSDWYPYEIYIYIYTHKRFLHFSLNPCMGHVGWSDWLIIKSVPKIFWKFALIDVCQFFFVFLQILFKLPSTFFGRNKWLLYKFSPFVDKMN